VHCSPPQPCAGYFRGRSIPRISDQAVNEIVSVYARIMLCFSRCVVHRGKLPEIYVRKEKTLKANFLSGAKTAPELREIGAGLFAYVQHGSWGRSQLANHVSIGSCDLRRGICGLARLVTAGCPERSRSYTLVPAAWLLRETTGRTPPRITLASGHLTVTRYNPALGCRPATRLGPCHLRA
jgi:hypothetical protein